MCSYVVLLQPTVNISSTYTVKKAYDYTTFEWTKTLENTFLDYLYVLLFT